MGTLLLWTMQFMNLINLYMLSTWLPTIARGMGMTTTAALMVGTMFQTGGAVGSIAIGKPIREVGLLRRADRVLRAAPAVMIALIGQPGLTPSMLFVVVFIAGFGILGGQAGNNALAATYYPTDLRSTGVGAALGIGRIGSILGPSVAEFMRPTVLAPISCSRVCRAGLAVGTRRRAAPRSDAANGHDQRRKGEHHSVSERLDGREPVGHHLQQGDVRYATARNHYGKLRNAKAAHHRRRPRLRDCAANRVNHVSDPADQQTALDHHPSFIATLRIVPLST